MPYALATDDDVKIMLDRIGVASVDDLFADIPMSLRFGRALQLPRGLTEPELVERAAELANANDHMGRQVSFLGGGSYDHYIPAICRSITARSEFATAYTPYQPELSQGTLQAIFEFQTAITRLTGLPVANASLYDGATAAAEACYLAEQTTGRRELLLLGSVSPHIRRVVATYADAYGMRVRVIPVDAASGVVTPHAVEAVVGGDTAAVLVQQPNAFGRYEDSPSLVAIADRCGAVPIVHVDPLSLGVLEAPGVYGAGVCVGDGQALGNAPSFGGPSFGFMAAHEKFTRRMPGRIVGQTVDAAGSRGYVLTLQTREQHIRREKATSNICTNQALNALAGIVYLAWLGQGGLVQLGRLLPRAAEYTRRRLEEIPGVHRAHEGPVFKEFLIQLPCRAVDVVQRCAEHGVHPGWHAGAGWPELDERALLVAVTEQRSEADVDLLVSAVEAAIG